jgi:uncharacterized protein
MENNTMTDNFDGRKIIMTSLVGSFSANLNTPESDRDYKYFITPTFDDLYTNFMYSNAYLSSYLDYDVHDVRKLTELLWNSNLNFIGALFHIESIDKDFSFIEDAADALATMNLPRFYQSTIGMHTEKMSKLNKGTGTTQALVDKFGYDTKQACHAMRCLFVLRRIASGMTVREALWFEGKEREILIGIKAGNQDRNEFCEYVDLWRNVNGKAIKEWFDEQKAIEEVKTWFDLRIKQAVGIKLGIKL